ncbi:hypothetical protein INT47_007273, partial [Mucor saturninus]
MKDIVKLIKEVTEAKVTYPEAKVPAADLIFNFDSGRTRNQIPLLRQTKHSLPVEQMANPQDVSTSNGLCQNLQHPKGSSCLVLDMIPTEENRQLAKWKLESIGLTPTYTHETSAGEPLAIAATLQQKNPFKHKKYCDTPSGSPCESSVKRFDITKEYILDVMRALFLLETPADEERYERLFLTNEDVHNILKNELSGFDDVSNINLYRESSHVDAKKWINVGYARKFNTKESDHVRQRLLTAMINKLKTKLLCQKVFVSPISNADDKFKNRRKLPSRKQSGMLHRLRKKMEEASADERLILMCSNPSCLLKTLENVRIPDVEKIHNLLTCKSCNKLWNRDTNVARNIHSIASYMQKNNNLRSSRFQRPATDPQSSI